MNELNLVKQLQNKMKKSYHNSKKIINYEEEEKNWKNYCFFNINNDGERTL